MNRFELFRTLRRHVKLSEKRSATYEQNKTAKVLIYIAAGFVICYLVFIAIMLSLIANSLTDMTTSSSSSDSSRSCSSSTSSSGSSASRLRHNSSSPIPSYPSRGTPVWSHSSWAAW